MFNSILKNRSLWIITLVFLAFLWPLSAQAADEPQTLESEKASNSAAVHSYVSDTPLQRGIFVRLDKTNQQKVLPVKDKDMIDAFGVVLDPSETALTVGNSEASSRLTYVATSGIYNVLVSNQAGQIKSGDYLTISSLEGIAMKANDKQSTVIGVARTNFDGKTKTIGEVTLRDDANRPFQSVNLGLIPVAVSIQHNPLIKNTRADLPEWLIKTGLVDKDIQPIRIYISFAILGLAIIVSITVLYAGIRHSVISIGRNPLSRGSIAKSLFGIFLSAFIILSIGGFTVYLLLKL